ncbi:MAG: translation initiation factor IF-3 [Flavobacteriales bacterium]|nr:translation initiation factor IF-3 [Flavobacteriales bacterium]
MHKINEHIAATQVRLVGEDIEEDIITLEQARALAEERDLDLVEITAKADPPICRILDYKKFLFEHKKKQKKIKANTAKVIVKELRFGPNTDEHDFNFKLKHAKKFLGDGAKLKAHVFFKGRTIVYKEKGEILLLRLAQELEEVGVVEQMPKLEGKRMIMFIVPKKKRQK